MVEQGRIAVIGGGVMGETILASVVNSGWPPEQVLVLESRAARAQELAQTHGVSPVASPAELADADAVIIAVKPYDVAGALTALAPHLRPDTVVASVAAGLRLAFYERLLPAGTPVIRVMPNTPAVIGAGISAISPGANATEAHLVLVERVLSATGTVVRVPEKNQDAVSAISGSGPAYAFYVIDALAEAGVALGLTRELALQLATETIAGAGRMVMETGEHPVILRERVSSPGGTTVMALREFDAAGVRAALIDGARAAWQRSAQLSAELEGEA